MVDRNSGVSTVLAVSSVLFIVACGSTASSPSDTTPSSNSKEQCSLDLSLAGTITYREQAADPVACASTLEAGPGAILIFLPKAKDTLTSVGLSLTAVKAGEVATGLGAELVLELPDGASPVYILGCKADLAENTFVAAEQAGKRYRLRGTGSCLPESSNVTRVENTFAFAASAVWK